MIRFSFSGCDLPKTRPHYSPSETRLAARGDGNVQSDWQRSAIHGYRLIEHDTTAS